MLGCASFRNWGCVRRRAGWLAVMAAVIMAGTMWRSVDCVMIPQQRAETARKNLTNGNFSDLYPRWVGAREVLLYGSDPYSSNVTAEIQKGYYGRTIDRTNPDDPVDEARFAYPLYVIFLLAPTVHISFESVKALYRFLAVGLSIASVWFWLRSLGHRGWGTRFITAAVLLLGSFPFVQGWYLTQLSLIVAALFAGTMLAVASGALWAAGIMLALTTIKPQLAIPLASWLMLWSASRWRERKALLLSFTASMAVLLAGAEILLPGWFWKWHGGISAYAQYVPTPPAHL